MLDALANVTRTHLPISDLAARSSLEERSLLDVAARLKTMPSIVAKLGRESTRLSQMQDIADGRIVLPLPELQDLAIQTLADSSGTDAQVVRVTDTRVSGEPHGYRAVHVVLSVGEGLTEIQVRTPLQQIWAQLVEAIDQRHGTDLKHGEGPPDWLRWLVALSAAYNRIESGETVELPPRPRSLPLEPE